MLKGFEPKYSGGKNIEGKSRLKNYFSFKVIFFRNDIENMIFPLIFPIKPPGSSLYIFLNVNIQPKYYSRNSGIVWVPFFYEVELIHHRIYFKEPSLKINCIERAHSDIYYLT